ncbi:hypothetical protein COOONC_03456 [Cooperia oncophora]
MDTSLLEKPQRDFLEKWIERVNRPFPPIRPEFLKRVRGNVLYREFLIRHLGELRKLDIDLHMVDKLIYNYVEKRSSRKYENQPDDGSVRAEAWVAAKAMEQFEKQLNEYKEALDREMTIIGKMPRSYYRRVNLRKIIDETRKARSAPSSPEPEKKKRRQCE